MSSNLETHKKITRCFNERDWDAIERAFAPDVSATDHAHGSTYKGVRELLDRMQRQVASFSDVRAEQTRYFDAGDHTVCLFQARGRNDGTLGPGAPPTRKRIDVPCCEVLGYDTQGRVVSAELFYDSMTTLAQLGIMEPPRRS